MTDSAVEIRDAEAGEIGRLARLWYDSWQSARLGRRGRLACAVGNDRATRFYEKWEWHPVGTEVKQLDTPNGNFPLEVWRYEKRLS